MSNFIVSNITAHPFENKHIKQIIDMVIRDLNNEKQYAKLWICDPFANNKTTRLQGTQLVTNDLNPKFDTTYTMEANDFGELMLKQKRKFDLILFDPPYSLRQLKDCYENIGGELPHWQSQNMWGRAKDALSKCVNHGGYVITLGWSSHGFGMRRGFEKIAVYNFEQAGTDGRYNIQVVVEKRCQTILTDY